MKKIIAVILLAALLCAFSISVSAVRAEEVNGFVEITTDASVNFEEIIDVVFKDTKNGYVHNFQLYRINDYAANISLPLGTYTVSSRILSSGSANSHYVLTGPTGNIEVNHTHLAVPVQFKVDIIDAVETVPPASGEEGSSSDGASSDSVSASDNSLSEESSSINDGGSSKVEITEEEKEKEPSLLITILIYVAIFIVGGIAFLLYRRKMLN